MMLCFNPRARRGRDETTNPNKKRSNGFNPRARRGRDDDFLVEVCEYNEVSIHAPAGGATEGAKNACRFPNGFNPRARRGRDPTP